MTKLIVLIANPPLKLEATPEKIFHSFNFAIQKIFPAGKSFYYLKRKARLRFSLLVSIVYAYCLISTVMQ